MNEFAHERLNIISSHNCRLFDFEVKKSGGNFPLTSLTKLLDP